MKPKMSHVLSLLSLFLFIFLVMKTIYLYPGGQTNNLIKNSVCVCVRKHYISFIYSKQLKLLLQQSDDQQTNFKG